MQRVGKVFSTGHQNNRGGSEDAQLSHLAAATASYVFEGTQESPVQNHKADFTLACRMPRLLWLLIAP
eukprot:6077072-Amphidinium_carterae.1